MTLLYPKPQQFTATDTRLTLPDRPLIRLARSPGPILATARRLQAALSEIGLRPQLTAALQSSAGQAAAPGDASITLMVHPALLTRPQSYRLTVDESGVTLVAADEAGLFYGVCTLAQLVSLHGRTLPGLRITDWPDYPHRGVMLDVSRDKVPTLETLFDLIDLLASWKINQLQLYTEHTFAYRGHEVVWQNASPLTGEDILALDDFCRQRHVELVPNQNSFGHLHRWLTHAPYRALAECPDGIRHPFSPTREPFSLCPIDPGSTALLTDLYDQLLPHFDSCQFNVGLDETFDLGQGRSADACREKGTGRVYLEFLHKIHRLVSERGRKMQFWGDIVLHHPELIPELPHDAIALAWGYEADHPFEEQCHQFANAGLSFYVCPGTSSWNSITGRTENALGNLSNAATNGQQASAIGYLNTDWGDYGHLQPLPVSYLGFLAGAGFSWNVSSAADPHTLDWPALLDAHAFRDRAGVMGQLAFDLGNAYAHTGARTVNSSALFRLLLRPGDTLPDPRMPGLTVEGLERTLTHINQTMALLPRARMSRPDADLTAEEFRWAADLLRLACRLGLAWFEAGPDTSIAAIPPAYRQTLTDELRPLIEQHRELWLQRNRPGGLDDSVARMEHLLVRLSE